MKVNGEILELKEEISLYDFLKGQGYDSARVAVELNGEIIPREDYASVILKNEYTMEVVSFVGGG